MTDAGVQKEVVIIGGGAAGFFAAINCAQKNPGYNITILEKSSTLLSKVKVSGGGRCNVTHACFEPKELIKYYPRGEKQLLGPFTRFNPSDTVDWFEKRGVKIKTEEDGRMFPVTDSSQTIINCFLNESKIYGVKVRMQTGLEDLTPAIGKYHWRIKTNKGEAINADAVIITSGSSAQVWKALENLGHTIVPAVPSLFTFNIKDKKLSGLEGVSVPEGIVSVVSPHPQKNRLQANGPILITHWGLSGPAVLRLSAWGARSLASLDHHFDIAVNWTGIESNQVPDLLRQIKNKHPKKKIASVPITNIPKRLWERLVEPYGSHFADMSNKQLEQISYELTSTPLHVSGKSTYKDEFVTAGGVNLDEVDFKTMQSKKFEGLYFAGEVLDIDAITGGFNLQAAWTTAFIAALSI